jgi:Lon protease-like protein
VLASYQLSALAPLGPADQQRLLEAPGPADRLLLLDTAIGDVEALLQFRLQHEIGGEMPEDVNGP